MPPTNTHVPPTGIRPVLTALIGQSTCLGIASSWIVTAASTLFLADFGSGQLPFVYIATAVAISAIFFGFSSLQRRIRLTRLAAGTVFAFTLLVGVSWLAVSPLQWRWISYLLMIFIPLGLQVGFVLLGAQAGRLLDLRQIKRFFPFIVTGFAIGFMTGGLAVSPLLRIFGKPEHLVILAALIYALMGVFILQAARRFAGTLDSPGKGRRSRPPRSLVDVIRSPYVALIFLYQMLSAMGSQLLSFSLYTGAAERFPDAANLAEFFGGYNAVLNLANILFLFLAASFLLNRFGIRLGLMANPGAVLVLISIVVVAGTIPAMAASFFWLIVITRIFDIVLTDGTTRTSLNAVYQSLPPAERVTAQTGVEGIGVPVAIGLTGAVLWIATSFEWITVVHVVIVTAIVTVGWTVAGALVFRGYGSALRKTLGSSALGATEVNLGDLSTRRVVEGLLDSPRAGDVHTALSVLAESDEEIPLAPYAERLLDHSEPSIRAEAWSVVESERIATLKHRAKDTASEASDPTVRARALRAYCALGETEAIDTAESFAHSTESPIRRAALVGLLRYGGIPGIVRAARHLDEMEASPDPAERKLLAEVIGDVRNKQFYIPLRSLLSDRDIEVRKAAALATGSVRNPVLITELVSALGDSDIRSEAAGSLREYGDAILPVVERLLADPAEAPRATLLTLVRICGELGSDRALTLMRQQIRSPDREIRLLALRSLRLGGFFPNSGMARELDEALAREERETVNQLTALRSCLAREEYALLAQSLEDELRESASRVFLLLSFYYDPATVLKAERQLQSGDPGLVAATTETLDVTLSGEHKRLLFGLAAPGLSPDARLEKIGSPSTETREATLGVFDILGQKEGLGRRPWLEACAIEVASRLRLAGWRDHLTCDPASMDPLVAEMFRHAEATSQS